MNKRLGATRYLEVRRCGDHGLVGKDLIEQVFTRVKLTITP